MAESAVTLQTYRFERWRAVANGILETGGTTFLLLIAVKHYEAGATAKALVASGGSVGLVLSPLVVSWVQQTGWRTASAAARIALIGALAMVVMALLPWVGVFVVGSVVAMAASSSAIPLLTQVYQENYPERKRGHFFSRTVMIRIAVAALFSELAGRALTGHMRYHGVLLLIFAGAFAFGAVCLSRFPSRPLAVSAGSHPFRALRYAREDRLFRQTLICWMLMGFANLMMLPMRVEYLANPRYGLAMGVGEIAFLTGVLPNIARLIMNPLWGWLFDRMNFFVLRVTLNCGFGLGILAFFTSDNLNGLILGAVVYGISNAGGDVAWGLWVTKFAPPDRVADYMSVHTFFTGVRGVLAPLLAFHLLAVLEIATLGWISMGMISVASLLLLPELKYGHGRRQATALVEEVSE
ncbi:MAG: MFS transporter [Verrucomicrobia bacterium]|nr:MFS transporter [Verrucomicrobiota bacterium]